MTQLNTITIETRGAIDILALNRPAQRNTVSPDMIAELTGYFSGLHDRPATRVVILRGNGLEFSAGAGLGSGAFAAPGKGGPQHQLKMQQRAIRRHPLDAILSAADHRACPWCRVWRRLFLPARL